MAEQKEPMELTEGERKVIDRMRETPYGKVIVTMKEGKPCYIETQKGEQIK